MAIDCGSLSVLASQRLPIPPSSHERMPVQLNVQRRAVSLMVEQPKPPERLIDVLPSLLLGHRCSEEVPVARVGLVDVGDQHACTLCDGYDGGQGAQCRPGGPLARMVAQAGRPLP